MKFINGRHLTEPFTKRLVKVALVEGQPATRKRWLKLINFFPDFVCSCACTSGEEALQTIPRERPDVVLIDIVLPHMSGIECTRRFKVLVPHTRVIIFTAMDDQDLVFLALAAGADGYLLKRMKPADLRIALLDVLNGGAPLTSKIARHVVESFRRKKTLPDESRRLTFKEERILMLLSQGYTNGLIAAKLELSLNTVCCQLKQVFKKFQVSSRIAAVACYMDSKTTWPKPDDPRFLPIKSKQLANVPGYQDIRPRL
jgi:DNA-binding NarL/FixJ family response regulator